MLTVRPWLSLMVVSLTALMGVEPLFQSRFALAVAQASDPVEASEPAESLYQQGVQQFRQGLYREAVQSLDQSLEGYRAKGDRLGEATALTQLSEVYYWLGEYASAREMAQVALALWRDAQHRAGEAVALERLGEAQEELEGKAKALETLQQALAIRREVGDRPGQGKTLLRLGAIYFKNYQYSEAEKALRQAQEILEQEDPFEASLALTWLGWFQLNREDRATGLQTLATALARSQSTGHRAAEFIALYFTAVGHFREGEYDTALENYQRSLLIAQRSKRWGTVAWVWLHIGLCHRNLQQFEQAEQAFKQSVEAGRQQAHSEAPVREALLNLAALYELQLNQPQQAEASLQAAIAHFPEPADTVSAAERMGMQQVQTARVWLRLGEIYGEMGERLKGLEWIRRGWQLRQTLDNSVYDSILTLKDARFIYASFLWGTGQFFQFKGQYPESLSYFQDAYDLSQTMGEDFYTMSKAEFQARVLGGLGLTYERLDQYDRAIAQYELALELLVNQPKLTDLQQSLTHTTAFAYINHGDQHRAKRNFSAAIAAYQQSRQLAQQGQQARIEILALISMANTYRAMQEYQKALPVMEATLAIAEKAQDQHYLYLARQTLARVHQALTNYPLALELFTQVLTYNQQSQEQVDRARTLAEMGAIYHEQGQYRRAYEAYEQVLQAFQEAQKAYTRPLTSENFEVACANPREFAEGGTMELLESFCQGRPPLRGSQAQIDMLNSARKNTAQGFRESEASALNSLSSAAADLGKSTQAIEFMQAALSIIQEGREPATAALYLNNLGVLYQNLGDYPQALTIHQQALQQAKALGDRQVMALSLSQIGLVYQNQGQYALALEAIKAALELERAIGNQAAQTIRLNNLGTLYREMGDYPQAIATLQEALALQRELGLKGQESTSLGNLARIYSDQGRDDQALQVHQQALQLAEATGSPRQQASARYGLAEVYINQAKYAQALIEYDRALQLLRQIGAKHSEANVLSAIGNLYQSLGQYDQAEVTYQQALDLAKTANAQVMSTSIQRQMASNARRRGQYEQALQMYQQSLATEQQRGHRLGVISSWLGLGNSYLQLKQWEPAETAFQQALELAKTVGLPSSQASALYGLGRVYQQQERWPTAETALRQALAIAQATNNPEQQASIFSALGELYTRQQEPEIAIIFYKQSVNTYESIRTGIRDLSREQQESYTQTVAETYRQLANLLISKGRIPEAQQVLELLKAEEIREFTRSPRNTGAAAAIALGQAEAKILQEHGSLIALGREVERCKQSRCPQLSRLNDQLQVVTEQYRQTVAGFITAIRDRRRDDDILDPSITRNLRKIVDAQPGTVLIYPFVLEDKTWLLWAARGGIVKAEPAPVTQQQLGEAVLAFRQQLQNPRSSEASIQATGKQLYDWLIRPLEAELKSNSITHLVFSLDRVTRYIPMAALFDGQQYLIERYQVSTILSAELTDTHERLPSGTQQTSVLAVGASEFQGYRPLPNVITEMSAIVRSQKEATEGIYPGLKFLNRAFDFRAMRDHLYGHQILHIATHGEFVPGRPEDSYLVTGTSEKLTIDQIGTLPDLKNVHLVVLSACETALGGPNQDGIEISGISSFFLKEGAKTVVASLWAVADESTSELMQAFYANLANPTPISKAEALRQAQLQALFGKAYRNTTPRGIGVVGQNDSARSATLERYSSQYAHPYYWAPFVLIGNSL